MSTFRGVSRLLSPGLQLSWPRVVLSWHPAGGERWEEGGHNVTQCDGIHTSHLGLHLLPRPLWPWPGWCYSLLSASVFLTNISFNNKLSDESKHYAGVWREERERESCSADERAGWGFPSQQSPGQCKHSTLSPESVWKCFSICCQKSLILLMMIKLLTFFYLSTLLHPTFFLDAL